MSIKAFDVSLGEKTELARGQGIKDLAIMKGIPLRCLRVFKDHNGKLVEVYNGADIHEIVSDGTLFY